MERQLKCVPFPSLKEMSLRTVVILSWSDPDVLASISEVQVIWLPTDESRKEWQEAGEDKVKDKLSKLELPAGLIQEAIDVVKPIGLQIRRWKVLNELDDEIFLLCLKQLCWTTVGKINYRKTAENLVCCDELGVVKRYEIACRNCLEGYIPFLWENLPKRMKSFYSSRDCVELEFHWPHILKGEFSKLDYLWKKDDLNLTSYYQWGFKRSVGRGNETAAKYFLQKLTPVEREASLMHSAHGLLTSIDLHFDDKMPLDVLCFLLTLMTPREERETIEKHPISLLLLFLNWPLQDLFAENANLFWTFFSRTHHITLLSKMTNRLEVSGHYFPSLFEEFFIHSPPEFKNCFVNHESLYPTNPWISPTGHFLYLLLAHADSESVKVIFRNIDQADKMKLVFHPSIFSIFLKSIELGRWEMVKVCLIESKFSEEEKMRWKEEFLVFFETCRDQRIRKGDKIWKGFLKFFNKTGKGKKRQKHTT